MISLPEYKRRRPRKALSARHRTLMVLVLCAGVAASTTLAFFVRHWEQAMVQAEFELLAGTQVGAIGKEVARHVDVIEYVGRLYSATEEIDEATFGEFVEGALALHGDIEFIGWAPLLDDEWNAVFRASAGNAGRQGPAPTDETVGKAPVGASGHHLPIYFVEPGGQGNPWFGFDLAGDPDLQSLMAEAGDTGLLRTSGRIHLRESSDTGGILFAFPVYAHGLPLGSTAERRAALRGVIVEGIRISGVVSEALATTVGAEINVEVHDVSDGAARVLLARRTPAVDSDDAAVAARSGIEWTTDLHVEDRLWELVFTPTAAFLSQHRVWRAWTVFSIGLVLTAILYAYVMAMRASSRRIEGLAERLSVTNRDLEGQIVARRNAEARSLRLAAVLEATSDIVGMVDKDGGMLYLNRAGRKRLGVGEESGASVQHIEQLHPAATASKIVEVAMPRALSDGLWSGETVFLTAEGEEFPASQVLVAHREDGGEVVYFSFIARDISERVFTEDRLRRSQTSLAAAQRIAHLGNWEWDLVNNTLVWSDELYRIFGRRPQELPATYAAFIDAVHPDDRERVDAAIQSAIRDRTRYSLQHRIVLPTGDERVVHTQGEVNYDGDNVAVRMVGIILDVTERQQIEAALQQEISERRHIEKAIREVTDAISSATGVEFFKGLVRRLTETLHVDYALVARIPPGSKDTVETVAVYGGGRVLENLSYRLEGTPCKEVLENNVCHFSDNVPLEYPLDKEAEQMGVQSYMGTPLYDVAGRQLGLVAIMSCTHMSSRQPAETILQVYAARIAAELQHMKAQEEIQSLVKFPDENPSPVMRISRDGSLLYSNHGSAHLLETWGQSAGQQVPSSIMSNCQQALQDGTITRFDADFGGRIYTFLLAPSMEQGYVNVYGLDITDRVQADAQMRKLSSALEQTADSVMITDREGVVEYINPMFCELTGFSPSEVVGERANVVKSGHHDKEFYAHMWQTILSGEAFRGTFVNRKKDGSLYYEEKTITPLRSAQGEITHFVSTGKDITERMQTEERLHYLAYHDVLTGLPNRALFIDRLKHTMAQRDSVEQRIAVLFLDLDRFKNINDTLGHAIGDRLLQALPDRLLGCVRKGDTVARLGGDEFAILVENVGSMEDASHIASKLIAAMAQPVTIDEHELFISTSIGISIFPDDSTDANALLKHADTAMYRAKDLGRNTYQFYSTDMSVKAFERLSMETSLRRALDRGEFELYYQPQVDLGSGRIVGAEALIRWHHSELGTVSPVKFIPLLEDTGLIIPVGEWVLRTAAREARTWQQLAGMSLRIAINLSSRQFHDGRFKEQVAEVIAESGLEPRLFDLEITESILMQNNQASMANLRALHGLGVRLSVDDFGTGYSSLSYLKRFTVDTLKIDRSFIHDVTSDQDDAAIVEAIVVMAHSLKLEVVAEGVETVEQFEFLRSRGCDTMQGFLFSTPVPAEQFRRLLQGSAGSENLSLLRRRRG